MPQMLVHVRVSVRYYWIVNLMILVKTLQMLVVFCVLYNYNTLQRRKSNEFQSSKELCLYIEKFLLDEAFDM